MPYHVHVWRDGCIRYCDKELSFRPEREFIWVKSQLKNQVGSPVHLEQSHGSQYSYRAPLDLCIFTLPAELT